MAVGPQVLEFVDEHGNEVLNLGSFTLLPQHVVRLVLCREELKADEFTKFQVHTSPPPPRQKKQILTARFDSQAALMWSKKYCDSNSNINLKEVLSNFLEFIMFHQIPANVLMREIHPIGELPSCTGFEFSDPNIQHRHGGEPIEEKRRPLQPISVPEVLVWWPRTWT